MKPTDASDEGEVMPNKPDTAMETTATDGRANAVTGDGASDKHASDAERAEVEALNARVAQLSEALWFDCPECGGMGAQGNDEDHGEMCQRCNGGGRIPITDEAAQLLAGTGTDWLEARLAQERERCANAAGMMMGNPSPGAWPDIHDGESWKAAVLRCAQTIRALGSADAP